MGLKKPHRQDRKLGKIYKLWLGMDGMKEFKILLKILTEGAVTTEG